MDRLWGEMRPVPLERMQVLAGGERLDLAGRTFDVAYTPGHANHHVSYLDQSTGTAYVGDTAGIRRVNDYIVAPTPPPDIDLEKWDQSLQIVERWRPSTLFLTHFGSVTDVAEHLRRFRIVLDAAARRVKATLGGRGHGRGAHPRDLSTTCAPTSAASCPRKTPSRWRWPRRSRSSGKAWRATGASGIPTDPKWSSPPRLQHVPAEPVYPETADERHQRASHDEHCR